jgi:preprotein translocase subunit SecG
MTTVLLVIHIMIAAALVGIVLMQKSEGGALGMGGGGFMSGRGQANFLTRTTAYLAAAFFATSIALTLLANQSGRQRSIFDTPAVSGAPSSPSAPAAAPGAPATPATPAAPTEPAAPRGGVLDKLNKQ